MGRLRARAPAALTSILTLDASGATAFGQYFGSEAALRRLIRPLGGRRPPAAPPTSRSSAAGRDRPAAAQHVRRLVALRRTGA